MTSSRAVPRSRGALVAAVVALAVGVLGGCVGEQSHTIIDWVDFVQVGDVQYLRATPLAVVPETALGQSVGTVRRELSTSDVGPDHHPQDGESAFLPAGTDLRAVQGYASDDRIAAKTSDGWVAYDAYPPRRTPTPTA